MSWADSSISKVFALQAQGHGFNSQHHTHTKKEHLGYYSHTGLEDHLGYSGNKGLAILTATQVVKHES